MGLNDALARIAVRRCHVLLVEGTGGTRLRMELEQEIARRGWVEASSPADADILGLCGQSVSGLDEPLKTIWQQLPGPRAWVHVAAGDDVAQALDTGATALLDHDAQKRSETRRPTEPTDHHDGDGHGQDHEDGDEAGGDHDGGEHSDAGTGHEDHDDGMDMDMDMDMSPGGIPLAVEGKDRDGLHLDVLNVSLGPILPLWPAGLVLHCTLQGDIVSEARAEFLFRTDSPDPTRTPIGRRAAAVHWIDLAVRMVRLAGSSAAAQRLCALRDRALDDSPIESLHHALMRERDRFRRMPLLARSLALGSIPADSAGPWAGTDAWERLLGMLEAASTATSPDDHRLPFSPANPRLVEFMVSGKDLGVVRLIVASLDWSVARALPEVAV